MLQGQLVRVVRVERTAFNVLSIDGLPIAYTRMIGGRPRIRTESVLILSQMGVPNFPSRPGAGSRNLTRLKRITKALPRRSAIPA